MKWFWKQPFSVFSEYSHLLLPEAVVQRYFVNMPFWRYWENSQENTHVRVLDKVTGLILAVLLKQNLSLGIFSPIYARTHTNCCFCTSSNKITFICIFLSQEFFLLIFYHRWMEILILLCMYPYTFMYVYLLLSNIMMSFFIDTKILSILFKIFFHYFACK